MDDPDAMLTQASVPRLVVALNAKKNVVWLVSSLMDVMLQFPVPHAVSHDPVVAANTQPKELAVDVVLVVGARVVVVVFGEAVVVVGATEAAVLVVIVETVVFGAADVVGAAVVVGVVGAAIEQPSGLQQHRRRPPLYVVAQVVPELAM